MQMTRVILLGWLACLAACGELKVRSTAPSQTLPAALEGRWVGTWTSSGNQGGGPIEIRIQQFRSEPVVQVQIDNPCLTPNDYDLALTGDQISLSLAGTTVMSANLLTEQLLDGIYTCAADEGVWQAEWVEGLPSLLDLSGEWEGRIFSVGEEELPFTMQVEQSVQGGQLVLAAQADLPTLSGGGPMAAGVPMQGYVRFYPEDFELTLFTPLGSEPSIYLTGIGERETLHVPLGVVQLQTSAQMPLANGTVQLLRQR